jgi:hypothetical protein
VDSGTRQTLGGSGTVRPLGRVRADGTLEGPGTTGQGQAQGTLTLTAAGRRSVTLALAGPLVPGAAPAPFQYTILGGTRLYRHASGGGVAQFAETPQQTGGCMPPRLCPAFIIPGRFTLTFPAGTRPARR